MSNIKWLILLGLNDEFLSFNKMIDKMVKKKSLYDVLSYQFKLSTIFHWFSDALQKIKFLNLIFLCNVFNNNNNLIL